MLLAHTLKTLLDTTPPAYLMKQLKEPFADKRYAVFHIMKGMCKHKWGIKELSNYPHFIDFLVDRNTEATKEGKEWKFSVAETIVQTMNENKDDKVLDPKYLVQLKAFLKQGPFFVKGEHRVEIATKTK